ncbi:MAG: 2-hydroxyacyl-CoA dehydratase, partial [Oscillospiraceae bacterium]|nr:2-hydroxyacyl-CoA dehydratase [Oscillospiraceae bacterium]
YKYDLLMKTELKPEGTPKARIGIPMVLSYFDQLPLWSRFFRDLGFEIVLSDESSRDMYYKGQQTIPSDTVCYPAKLVHGHIADLLEKNVDFIFYPCMSYNLEEPDTDNHYNCPVVAYYPELLKANIPELNEENFKNPYLDLNRNEHVAEVMADVLGKYGINKKQTLAALEKGFEDLEMFRKEVEIKAKEIIEKARKEGKMIIVLAGRPYHLDKEINHGINKLITSLGMAVVTEDSVSGYGDMPDLDVLNQWTYHSRMYRAADYVTKNKDMQLVQLVSFGCGIDAITTDEIRSILESKGKLYTQLKIDEISNLGAAKIRLRSLMAAAETDKE